MVNLYKQDGETLYGIKEYLIDSKEDLKDLPTKKIKIGSTAVMIPDGILYILNSNYEWVEFGGFSSSGDESSDSTEAEELLGKIDANKNGMVDGIEMTIF